VTLLNGAISPVITNNSLELDQIAHSNNTLDSPDNIELNFGPFKFDPETVVEYCKKLQHLSELRNQRYREANNLTIKYEYNHFIVEGHVLYLMDEEDRIIGRTMYKVKPRDIEEVHWVSDSFFYLKK
jgi:hypothetical protein